MFFLMIRRSVVVIAAGLLACLATGCPSRDLVEPANPWIFDSRQLDEAHAVQQTADGGYVIAGHSSNVIENCATVLGYYDYDFDWCVMKVDDSGHIQWEETFGGDGIDRAQDVRQTADGGYIVAGYLSVVEDSEPAAHMIKLGEEGDVQWEKTLESGAPDRARVVQQTADGGYVVAGTTGSMSDAGLDLYIVKLDGAGNTEWENSLGEHDWSEEPCALQQTSDGGYLFAGTGRPHPMYVNAAIHGDCAPYAVKTDDEGNEVWWNAFEESPLEQVNGAVETPDGGYVFAGTCDLDSTKCLGALKGMHLVKTDGGGEVLWEKTIDEVDSRVRLCPADDGGFLLTGRLLRRRAVAAWMLEARDIRVVRTDENGDVLWAKTVGTSNKSEYIDSVQPTSDGGYVLAGNIAPNFRVSTMLLVPQKSDFYVIRLDDDGNVL